MKKLLNSLQNLLNSALSLTANDTILDGSDTVTVNVFDQAYISYHLSESWSDDLADEITLSIWMKTADGGFGDNWAGLITRSNEACRKAKIKDTKQ